MRSIEIARDVRNIMRSAADRLAELPPRPAHGAGVALARVLDSVESETDRDDGRAAVIAAAEAIADAWGLARDQRAVLSALLERRDAITSTQELVRVTGVSHTRVPGLVLGLAPKLLRINWSVEVASYGCFVRDPARRTLGPVALEGRTVETGVVRSPATSVEWLVTRRLILSYPHSVTGSTGSEEERAVDALRALLAPAAVTISPPPWRLVFA